MRNLLLTVIIFGFGYGLRTRGDLEDYQRQKECFEQEKIYFEAGEGCFKLLTKGPCSRGEWLVLKKPRIDSEPKIEAECVPEKCKDGEYYWSETRSCVKSRDKAVLCGNSPKEELRNNLFGEGECSCTMEPPMVRLNNDMGEECHVLYAQGPCRPGEVLGFENARSDEPTCITDRCYQETLRRRRNRLLSPDAVLAPWKNNTCYELGTPGPCPKGVTFKVHSQYLTPTCVSLTNRIFDLDQDCFPDESGNCQEKINSAGENFKRGLLRATRRRRNSGPRKAD